MNLIGLGNTGCAVAKRVSEYNKEAYNTFLIDTKKHTGFKSKKVEQQQNPELFETNYKSCKRFLANLEQETVLILSGQDLVTSCVLRLLEEIRLKTKIVVLYIMPDIEILPKVSLMHERMIRGVLQQYARSALLERIYLISANNVSEIMGPVSLSDHEEAIYSTISYYFHMLNYYDNSKSIMSNNTMLIDPARISTLGVFDVHTKEEKMFFNLEFPREVLYYYGLSQQAIETDIDLYKSIKDHIKDSEVESASYKIFQLTSETDCGIVIKHASYVQK